ncbi:MAG: response regulator [Acidimicrobiia bacterium]|nr:response regulator [Acidimicrobiia bacterium]MBV8983346.1 response regulator [Acidimicrobiia bacterium]MBV9040487.1 response regulator [Acidimicrobiia bacterium]
MKVLICDDESDIRLLYRTAFEQHGADVVVTKNGDECVQVAADDQPDMVILDLMMPIRDGFSTLAELHGRWPSTIVYIVSAFASPENFMRSRALGAKACYDKIDFLGRIPTLIESGTAA